MGEANFAASENETTITQQEFVIKLQTKNEILLFQTKLHNQIEQ